MGFGFDLNLGGTVLFHIQLFSGCVGEIDDPIPHIRPPVIDPDLDLFVILRLVTVARVPIGKLGWAAVIFP